jgi:dihydroorotase
MQFDILLKGGHIIDPLNGIDSRKDVAISDGRIAAVENTIPINSAKQPINVEGLVITPGLVDIHTHMYATPGWRNAWAGDNSILPDGFSFRSGVTTMVDTGSAGWRTFPDFRERVLTRFQTRMYAFLNIVGMGMVHTDMEQNIADMDIDRTVSVMKEHNDFIVGSKTAHFMGPEWISTESALRAGQMANMPAMIDFGLFPRERPYYELVTERMSKDDISTHMFLGDVPWLDDEGRILPYLHKARKRGVIFDVGHGGGSFYWRNAVPATEQGFYPDSISTDLHTKNMNEDMLDMVTVMSKFLIMGMPLYEIIRASTINPASQIGHRELGHLSIGTHADIAGLKISDGDFGYTDVASGLLRGNKRITCELTLKDGIVMWDWNGRIGVDYKTLEPMYGVRNPDGLILPPKTQKK